jgi:hypothetical protein
MTIIFSYHFSTIDMNSWCKIINIIVTENQLRSNFETESLVICCIATMFIGMDDEHGPRLYKCDPAGHFLGYKAMSSGTKEQEAVNILDKKIKNNPQLSYDETVQVCSINSLSSQFLIAIVLRVSFIVHYKLLGFNTKLG